MPRAQQWLSELLRLSGLTATVCIISPQEVQQRLETVMTNGSIPAPVGEPPSDLAAWLEIEAGKLTPDQVQALLGERGAVLDSIQYLANATLNLGVAPELQQAYTIDLQGYRVKRLIELRAIAEHAAAQVRATLQEFEIEALSSAERRQVHTFLKDCDDLVTESRGAEPDRRLVVRIR